MNKLIKANVFMILIFIIGKSIAIVIGLLNIDIYSSMFISQTLMLCLPFALYLFISKTKLKNVLYHGSRDISFGNIIFIVIISLFSVITVDILLTVLVHIFGNFSSYFLLMSDTSLTFLSIQYFLTLLAFVFIPAILNELVFRGIILEGFEYENTYFMLGLSGLYFSLIHTGVGGIIYGFIIGIILGYIFIMTKNIIGPILAHFIINIYTFHYFVDTSKVITDNTVFYGLFSIPILAIILLGFSKYNLKVNPKRQGYKQLEINESFNSKVALSIITFGVMVFIYIKF